MDNIELNKLKIALDQINNGESVDVAVAAAEYVNYDQRLIDKINILKNITILNPTILKYLYNIKLTDKISEVAPKVNAIYQLAVSSNLIEDKALNNDESDNSKNFTTDNNIELAANVLRTIMSINK